jgi:hypothetical protein
MLQLLDYFNIDPSSLFIFTLMMEAIRSYEMSVTRVTRRRIPEDSVLHPHSNFAEITNICI